jgi:hypothetical protein
MALMKEAEKEPSLRKVDFEVVTYRHATFDRSGLFLSGSFAFAQLSNTVGFCEGWNLESLAPVAGTVRYGVGVGVGVEVDSETLDA